MVTESEAKKMLNIIKFNPKRSLLETPIETWRKAGYIKPTDWLADAHELYLNMNLEWIETQTRTDIRTTINELWNLLNKQITQQAERIRELELEVFNISTEPFLPTKEKPMNKRRWIYAQHPAIYSIACDKCGGVHIDWSEYEHQIWCYDCKIDTPGSPGIFDGPIPIGAAEILGVRFDRIYLKTDKLYKMVTTKKGESVYRYGGKKLMAMYKPKEKNNE